MQDGYVSCYLSYHSGQRLAWATLHELCCTGFHHGLHFLCPTHTARKLGNQVLLYLHGISMSHAVYILIDGTYGSMEFRCSDGSLQFLLGRLHQGTVESAAYGQQLGTACTCLEELSAYAEGLGSAKLPGSGKQEMLESIVNSVLFN